MPLLITLFFYTSFVHAQSASDTDPNRWENVKSWTGTFTFTSKDEISRVEGNLAIESSTDIDIDGNFTIDAQVTTVATAYAWQGTGIASGPYWWELITIDNANGSSCTTLHYTTDPVIPPLVGTPGYILEWFLNGPNKGKYYFQTGEIKIPATITTSCDSTIVHPPESQDVEIGGGSTMGYRTLPASGYRLTGDAEVENFNGYNNASFHWDLQPKEFKPPTPTCPFEAALHDTVKLNILRAMRNAMATTPAGIQLVYLYYSNVAEVTKIIATDAELRNQFERLIINNMNYAQELITEREATIPCEAMRGVITFLNQLKTKGGTKLNKDTEWLLQGIEDTSLLNSLGIIVIEK